MTENNEPKRFKKQQSCTLLSGSTVWLKDSTSFPQFFFHCSVWQWSRQPLTARLYTARNTMQIGEMLGWDCSSDESDGLSSENQTETATPVKRGRIAHIINRKDNSCVFVKRRIFRTSKLIKCFCDDGHILKLCSCAVQSARAFFCISILSFKSTFYILFTLTPQS